MVRRAAERLLEGLRAGKHVAPEGFINKTMREIREALVDGFVIDASVASRFIFLGLEGIHVNNSLRGGSGFEG